MFKIADSETAFAIPVSNKEKQQAKALRSHFEEVLVELEKFKNLLLVFFDHADDLKEGTDLSNLSPLIKKFQFKLRSKFNGFIKCFEQALIGYNNSFTNTKIDEMRDLLIENARTTRRSLLDLLRIFKKVSDPEFLQEAKTEYANIEKAISQFEAIIKEELFEHIDFDILGKIKLGMYQAPLVIREI